ncbi:hypothetical protein BDY21DRAFT_162194 [Lineolata rhizophorae]|uniref:Uncharacterized protein n=1 Tax=Lineolata rhizophorae TaxID=578093 RepID=A0A6A6P968_9PEZI|nr:hypothetical protein BDY21DRAFT_162194 [Lineolata rhizophorae]
MLTLSHHGVSPCRCLGGTSWEKPSPNANPAVGCRKPRHGTRGRSWRRDGSWGTAAASSGSSEPRGEAGNCMRGTFSPQSTTTRGERRTGLLCWIPTARPGLYLRPLPPHSLPSRGTPAARSQAEAVGLPYIAAPAASPTCIFILVRNSSRRTRPDNALRGVWRELRFHFLPPLTPCLVLVAIFEAGGENPAASEGGVHKQRYPHNWQWGLKGPDPHRWDGLVTLCLGH